MSIRPRKPKPQGPRSRRLSKDEERVSLNELNEFAEKMADKYFSAFTSELPSSIGPEDFGPYLDDNGRLGGGFFGPGQDPRVNAEPLNWREIDDIINAPLEATPAEEPPEPPAKKSKFGRMIVLPPKKDITEE